ncbi:MAG TPA: hypothetical protein VIL20_02485 [Sandaracinaceae bacterium]
MREAIALLCLCLSGCTHAGILELTVELPPPEGDVRYAVIDARPASRATFADAGDVATFPLGEPAALSIVAGADTLSEPLEVRIRFCTSEGCESDLSPSEVRVRIERAFYSGVHTFLTLRIASVPTAAERLPPIDACQVRGCTPSTGASYCLSDGTHLCEH